MKQQRTGSLAAGAALLMSATHAFSASSTDNVVLYWGQNSAGSQQRLSTYCQDATTDIIPISFLTTFGAGTYDINFANACGGTPIAGSSLIACDQIAADIKTCQAAGKKILLSMGGAAGSYGFGSAASATQAADDLWNYFGGGSSSIRPFGDAQVDGFDLDIENNNPNYYPEFIAQMRSHYASQSAKTYYIAGAPQCPYPDASLATALANSYFDFLFIQFYNNYCGINTYVPGTSTNFNYGTWDNWAKTVSANKNVRLYLGVAAATGAANAGSYVSPSVMAAAAQELKKNYGSTFGGVMMWDASQAYANTPSWNGQSSLNYAQIAKAALTGSTPQSNPTTPATSSTTSTPPIALVTPTTSTTPIAVVTPTTSTTPVAVVTPPVTSTSASSGCAAPVYTVVAGDYCNLILSKTGSVFTLDGLYGANPSINSGCTNLQVGQVVVVGPVPSSCVTTTSTTVVPTTTSTPVALTTTTPAGPSPSTTTCTYTVVPGDTCNVILSKTGNQVSLDAFYKLNPAVNSGCTNLQVGQVVIVSSGSGCAAAATTTATGPTGVAAPPASTSLAGTCPVAGAGCADGSYACAGYGFAQCVFGKWVMRDCGAGTACRSAGTNNVYCDFIPQGATVACTGIQSSSTAAKLKRALPGSHRAGRRARSIHH